MLWVEITILFSKSLGSFCCSYMILTRLCRLYFIFTLPALRSSAGIPSIPRPVLFFTFIMLLQPRLKKYFHLDYLHLLLFPSQFCIYPTVPLIQFFYVLFLSLCNFFSIILSMIILIHNCSASTFSLF